jgi:hypothetical protein
MSNSQVNSPNLASDAGRNVLKNQRSNVSENRSENPDGMVTPRNLPGNNNIAGGSGSLPVDVNQVISNPMLENGGSATQS